MDESAMRRAFNRSQGYFHDAVVHYGQEEKT